MRKSERLHIQSALLIIQECADAAHRESERNFELFKTAKTQRDRAYYLALTDDSRHEAYAFRESIRIIKDHLPC